MDGQEEVQQSQGRQLTDLTIDETNLDHELSQQAQYFLWAAEQAIRADATYNEFKLQADQFKAALYQKVRDDLKAKGEKPTEAMIEQNMTLDPGYIKANRHLNKLRTDKEVLKAVKEAWYMRQHLLVQIAIKARSELESMMATTVKSPDNFKDIERN